MKTSDFDYDLPPEFIAQVPVEPRDQSRLMVLNRSDRSISHTSFHRIGDYLQPGDLLVLNETRVIPARLYAAKQPGGGKVELLLLNKTGERSWEVLVGGKGLQLGRRLKVVGGPGGEVVSELGGARRQVRFDAQIEPFLERAGHVPLPPYIKTRLEDPERYQTVFAHTDGSAAAPTAGLHFTHNLIEKLQTAGVNITYITLHVGLDTFAPVTEDDPQEHEIHTEYCQLSPEAANLINATRQSGKRIIAVGTTSVRTLESAARNADRDNTVGPFEGSTDLFILPDYKFQAVDSMVTNFHLPRSSLIMLVSAFYERKLLLEAYEHAKEMKYRFYSFGDAMLIL